jgi:G:T-mismatch repair DNA endonuclease (very short patch repair protein)
MFDPKVKGDPCAWRMDMLRMTDDPGERSATPLTVIRSSDFKSPSHSSRIERAVRSELVDLGLPICPHVVRLTAAGKSTAPDIVVPSSRVVIEYDGSYWHHEAASQDADRRKSGVLVADGWRELRIRECGLNPLDFESPSFAQFSTHHRSTAMDTGREVMGQLAAREWL